jgi:hypothetical protein
MLLPPVFHVFLEGCREELPTSQPFLPSCCQLSKLFFELCLGLDLELVAALE